MKKTIQLSLAALCAIAISCGEPAMTAEQIEAKATTEFEAQKAELEKKAEADCEARKEMEVEELAKAMLAGNTDAAEEAVEEVTEEAAAEELTDEQKIQKALTAKIDAFKAEVKEACSESIKELAIAKMEEMKAAAQAAAKANKQPVTKTNDSGLRASGRTKVNQEKPKEDTKLRSSGRTRR